MFFLWWVVLASHRFLADATHHMDWDFFLPRSGNLMMSPTYCLCSDLEWTLERAAGLCWEADGESAWNSNGDAAARHRAPSGSFTSRLSLSGVTTLSGTYMHHNEVICQPICCVGADIKWCLGLIGVRVCVLSHCAHCSSRQTDWDLVGGGQIQVTTGKNQSSPESGSG